MWSASRVCSALRSAWVVMRTSGRWVDVGPERPARATADQAGPAALDRLRTLPSRRAAVLCSMPIDGLDQRLIALLTDEPRIGVLEASRRLGVARGTVQARLDKLVERGVVRSFGPDVDPAALGYDVTAFVTLEISQAAGADAVTDHLSAIQEVLEAHTITGSGDLLVRIVARSNADLQRVIDRIVGTEGIHRSASVIALQTQVPYRVLPLVEQAARDE